MSPIWFHLEPEYALYQRRMAIAVPGEFHEKFGTGTEGCAWQLGGRSMIFLQTIVRADVPWRAVWRGSRRSMDTNRYHRASGCALEADRKAIGVQGELQERVGPGTNQSLTGL